MSDKVLYDSYNDQYQTKILVLYKKEIIRKCYENYHKDNKEKKYSKEYHKQFNSISKWPKEMKSGWIRGFKKRLSSLLDNIIQKDVSKLLMVRKIQSNNESSTIDNNSNLTQLYGDIYEHIDKKCENIIGNRNHFQKLEFPSKTELLSLLESIKSFLGSNDELTSKIVANIWNNQK
ncbi:MAG: hypothetical protein ACRCXE_01695 [Metamycoplasmataceae bacterium]